MSRQASWEIFVEWEFGMATPLGQKIRNIRKQNKMSMDELAKVSGCSKTWIWELENREDVRPSSDTIIQIAKGLNVKPDFLLSESLFNSEYSDDEAFFDIYRGLDRNLKSQVRDLVWLLVGK